MQMRKIQKSHSDLYSLRFSVVKIGPFYAFLVFHFPTLCLNPVPGFYLLPTVWVKRSDTILKSKIAVNVNVFLLFVCLFLNKVDNWNMFLTNYVQIYSLNTLLVIWFDIRHLLWLVLHNSKTRRKWGVILTALKGYLSLPDMGKKAS